MFENRPCEWHVKENMTSQVFGMVITNSRTQMLKLLKLLFPRHAMQACVFYLVLVPCVLFDVKEFGKANLLMVKPTII